MTILAIDPGPTESGWVKMDENYRVIGSGVMANEDMLGHVCGAALFDDAPRLVIEQIASFGMAVGAETFDTCVWTGRFMQVCATETGSDKAITRIPRVPIKVHLCGTAKAKDPNVRQALIDRYGGSDAIRKHRPAKRNRKGEVTSPEVEPGALAGVSAHAWAALAVAVVYLDRVKAGMV